MTCVHFVVHGRVQGVFYRASAQDTARRLGLRGWVRNCSDGTVELVACGDEAGLRELQAWLGQGPKHARVDRVAASGIPEQDFDGFVVRRDG
jgi:acylphosphatase